MTAKMRVPSELRTRRNVNESSSKQAESLRREGQETDEKRRTRQIKPPARIVRWSRTRVIRILMTDDYGTGNASSGDTKPTTKATMMKGRRWSQSVATSTAERTRG